MAKALPYPEVSAPTFLSYTEDTDWDAENLVTPAPGGRETQAASLPQADEDMTISAHFQPIMIDGALVLEVVIDGMTEASATRRPSMP